MTEEVHVPPHLQRAAHAWGRYKTMMKWVALVAILASACAWFYLRSSGNPVPLRMVIAGIAGLSLLLLLGTGLMGLVFLSNSAGQDDQTSRRKDQG